LRQRASELLRQVQRGESTTITDRGRPVAVLAPVPDGSQLERLRVAGEVRTAETDLDDLPAALAAAPDEDPPSVVLARLRLHER